MIEYSSEIPLTSDPKALLLELAQQHSVDSLLRLIVTRLAESPRVALVRVWLVQKTSDCTGCPSPEICRDKSKCLQLVASAGQSIASPEVSWTDVRGAFQQIPLGVRKVGKIAETGMALEVPDLTEPLPDWVARPDWILAEKVRGFAGQPLIYRGEVVGVLAVFARGAIGPDCMGWLRMFADHAASSIMTARAFSEIEALRKQLELENEYLREEVVVANSFGELVGQSPALENVSRQIDLVAATDATVLILGESGTGKELVARELHRRSRRAQKPLIKVNCAAVPRELYESEFFGHAKGAFTGALRDRVGRFELADQGTIFLDEVGEIPVDLQAKLLRVLQEGELERIGEERTRRVNFRLIAATNRDLQSEADAGRFRQDLYYRLSVFPIEIPPLRRRKEDIPLLADHFLTVSARKAGLSKPTLTLAGIQRLQTYDWPGNIRELQHVIERAVITAVNGRLNLELPASGNKKLQSHSGSRQATTILTSSQLRDFEASNIRAALKATNGKISGPGGAAELLQMKPTTLASRIKALEITDTSQNSAQ